VSLDLIDRAMALGNTLAVQLEIGPLPRSDFKGEPLDRAGLARDTIDGNPLYFAKQTEHRTAFQICSLQELS
jgi:hypothetical protein